MQNQPPPYHHPGWTPPLQHQHQHHPQHHGQHAHPGPGQAQHQHPHAQLQHAPAHTLPAAATPGIGATTAGGSATSATGTTGPPRAAYRALGARASSSSATTFSPQQQALQARSKPFASAQDADAFESQRRREHAATILDSVELLMWYSGARNESISQTRQHFTNIVLGLDDQRPGQPPANWREEWDVPPEERVGWTPFAVTRPGESPRSASGKGRRSGGTPRKGGV